MTMPIDLYPRLEQPMSYVYIVRSGELHKIGNSIDLRSRLACLPRIMGKLTFVHAIVSRDGRWLEKLFHAKFFRFHVEGEWFRLSDEDLRSLCDITALDKADLLPPWLQDVDISISHRRTAKANRAFRSSRSYDHILNDKEFGDGTLNDVQMAEILRSEIMSSGETIESWAKSKGFTRSYISLVLARKRRITEDIAAAINYKPIFSWAIA